MTRHTVTYHYLDDATGTLSETTGVVITEHGADVLTLRVHLTSGFDRTAYEAPRCDPATPTAGCWSEIP
jgi:hypothetical protein